MAVTNETSKSGFREIDVKDVGDKWTKSTNAEGHTVYTSNDPAATARIKWAKDDEQTHGTTLEPMNAGSTIERWTDSNGVKHAVVTRKV